MRSEVTTSLRVLIVEDCEDDLLLVLRALRKGGFEPVFECVTSTEEVPSALEKGPWEIVLSDFNLPGRNGLATLEAVKASGRDLPVILVSGAIGEETAVEAMRAGVHDYIMKDNLTRLVPAVRREIQEAKDRAQRRAAEDALERERELAEVTLASIGDGVIRTDEEGRIEYLNPQAMLLTGWTGAEAKRRPLREIVHIVDAETKNLLLDTVQQALRDRRHHRSTGSRLLITRNGSEVPVKDSAAPVFGSSGTIRGAVLVLQDLTQQRQLELRMSHIENHDPGTGLANRHGFDAALEQALIETRTGDRSHCLCYLDIDRFRVFNSSRGPTAGDALLRHVASILSEGFEHSAFIARLGADEFGVLLRDCSEELARENAARILLELEESRFVWEGDDYKAGASMGLVVVNDSSSDLNTLVGAATGACEVAKQQGGNQIYSHQVGDREVAARRDELQLVSRLQNAIEMDAFALYCQPILPLNGVESPRVLYEILLRLPEPDSSMISPGVFAAAAERYGIMPDIDRWVVAHSLNVLSSIAAEADAAIFTINLSGQSLSQASFVSFVAESLARCRIPPQRICFEITETAVIAELRHALRFITMLQGLGCGFALDDFGSGVSSFGYLRSLPVDYLKIDGSFASRLVEGSVEYAIVNSINEIAHMMGLKTIAEWVEDEATAAEFGKLGVDFGQGYWYGHPQPLTAETLKGFEKQRFAAPDS